MAKDPADRYPSAGDLGRAAVAAAEGDRVDAPERSVATGVAAAGIPSTRTMSAAQPVAPTLDVPRPAARETRTVAQGTPSPSRRRLRAAGIVIATLAVLGIGAGGFVMASKQSGETSQEPGDKSGTTSKEKAQGAAPRKQQPAEPQRASEPIGGGATEAPVDSSQTSYASYAPSDQSYHYRAEIPQGGGWLAPTESYPTGGALLRTSVRGPDGQFVLIDRTPSEVPVLGGGFDSSGVIEHPVYGSVTEYVISNSDQIPECNGTQVCRLPDQRRWWRRVGASWPAVLTLRSRSRRLNRLPCRSLARSLYGWNDPTFAAAGADCERIARSRTFGHRSEDAGGHRLVGGGGRAAVVVDLDGRAVRFTSIDR